MFKLFINPLSIYQNLEEPWKWVLYFLGANVSLLAIATTLVGMVLYGKIFALSIIFWTVIWLIIVVLGSYLTALIGRYILKNAGITAKLGDTLLPYGLALGTNILTIILYTGLDLTAEAIPRVKSLIPLVMMIGFGRYVRMAAHGLTLKYGISSRSSLIVVLVSLLPMLLILLLFI